MVKIKNKRKLKWCLINYTSGKITQKWAATYLGITPLRFRQLLTEYKTTGNVPAIGDNIGRPKREVSDEWKDLIKQEYETYRLNALYMEKTIYARHKIRIFLADMKDYGTVNEIYATYFENDFPTRVALAVKELPLGALIEMDCTACGDEIKE